MDISVTSNQIIALFILAIPIASIARTVVNEEVFREAREFCIHRSSTCRTLLQRKFFYVFTCEYCFSHWVTMVVLILTGYRLLYADWRGVIVAFFSLAFVANCYLGLYARLRVDITSERASAEVKKKESRLKDAELREAGLPAADEGKEQVAAEPKQS